MKVNEQRKQMYLNGEVGMKWHVGAYEDALKIEPNASPMDNVLWRSAAPPVSMMPLSWFFEQDEPQTKPEPSRLEVAKEILLNMMNARTYAMNQAGTMVEFAYQCADELIKQSKL